MWIFEARNKDLSQHTCSDKVMEELVGSGVFLGGGN